MELVEAAKRLARALFLRLAFLAAGCGVLLLTVRINTGNEILAGFLSPESPEAIAWSVARLLGPALGLYLIYRGLR